MRSIARCGVITYRGVQQVSEHEWIIFIIIDMFVNHQPLFMASLKDSYLLLHRYSNSSLGLTEKNRTTHSLKRDCPMLGCMTTESKSG